MDDLSSHFLDEQDLLNLIDAVERQGEADWQLFLSYATVVQVAAGDVLIKQHDIDRSTYVLTEGELSVEAEDESGSVSEVATVKPVAIFGEQTFLDGKPRSATLRARTPAVIHRLTLNDFDRLRVEEPEIACAFLFDVARSMSLRLRAQSEN